MKSAPPPLRFLVLVVGGWACMRAIIIYPGPSPTPLAGVATAAAVAERIALRQPPHSVPAFTPLPKGGATAAPTIMESAAAPGEPRPAGHLALASSAPAETPPAGLLIDRQRPELAPYRVPERPSTGNRLSGTAWIFVRRGGAPQLAAGGLLGGSQAGARISYRLNRDSARPVALSARVYAPLASLDASEAAIGVSWKPVAGLPVEVLAERREALGPDGRSAFSLIAYGGLSDRPVLGSVQLDAYAQAGVVGLTSRDFFADGSALLTVPLAPSGGVKAGVGVWGAAQPGLSRLDIGPHVSARLPSARARLAAEWRLRVAGSAKPASGPALTLSADF